MAEDVVDSIWARGDRSTIPELFARRLEADPDGEYLDMGAARLTARDVVSTADAFGAALDEMGVGPGDRVATLIENGPPALLAWAGTVLHGRIAVPVNTAYKGDYLAHQLTDSGARVLVVAASLLDRVAALAERLPALEHVVVVPEPPVPDSASGDNGPGRTAELSSLGRLAAHRWDELIAGPGGAGGVQVRPDDLATFIYTGGTTGLSKGCMLSHNYHEALARQIGICWRRTAEDVVWTPLPLYHFNALTTVVVGTLLYGGRGAIYRRFSVSEFWPEMNRVGATVTSTLGTMAYLLAHDVDRPEMPHSGRPEANRTLRLLGAAPLPPEVDGVIRSRFGIETFSGAYGVTEASLVSWQPPGVGNRPNAAGLVNDEYFDVRIFDDEDNEVTPGVDGEIVLRPKRPHVMFEGYWGRPEETVATSRNLWYHTGDLGRIDEDRYLYFVDRKADYLRRRGENIASFEVERILMGHGALADVAVHAVPSPLTEDDLKITATLREGGALDEEELFRWCIDRLPYFALPRFIEFRDGLPRSPVGRVLKRELRDEGVTPTTWDAEAAGISYERR
ncbi:MAG TPA: AMP-binding protein [Acidimicrobiales bacterium]|jgi:crotonobetaine/carnitine-CoA ligase|nr:AMP-binding protein [Acidimicrobiales bacterium]